MMKLDLDFSFCCPAFRKERWAPLVSSILNTTDSTKEIIIIGPKSLPPELENDSRVRFIYDAGCPTKCLQRAVSVARGRRFMILTDDGVMMPGAQDHMEKLLAGADRKTIVFGKYNEGEGETKGGEANWEVQMRENYLVTNTSAHTASPYISNECYSPNFGYIDTSYFIELGGLDCRFETLTFPFTDFSSRAHRDGIKYIRTNFKVFQIDVDPPTEETHRPVYECMVGPDLQLYRSIYDNPDCVNRIKIDFDNWKNAPEVWDRRFPGGKV